MYVSIFNFFSKPRGGACIIKNKKNNNKHFVSLGRYRVCPGLYVPKANFFFFFFFFFFFRISFGKSYISSRSYADGTQVPAYHTLYSTTTMTTRAGGAGRYCIVCTVPYIH